MTSTPRHKALNFNNSRKSRVQANNPFETKKTVPAFQEKKQSNEQDISNESAQLRKEEKQITNDQDADIIDQKSFTSPKETGKTQSGLKVTPSSFETTSVSELKSAFAKVWSIVDNINIPAVQFDQKSSFTPNCISLSNVIFQMEKLLDSNEELRWKSPHYFSLPVRLYYSVLFYIQVLQAKEAAGVIKKSEGSWLRAFKRKYKDVSLPVAGPLVAIFTNLACYLPDDPQFNYVYPTLPKNGTYTTKPNTNNVSNLTVDSTHFLFPSVPMLADMLRQFCAPNSELTKNNFDEIGNYVPFNLKEGGNLGGIIFPKSSDASFGSQFSQILLNPMLAHPIPESKLRLAEIHTYWKRSRLSKIPEIKVDQDYNPVGLSDMTLLDDEFEWFEPCVDMALMQSTFFQHSTNLSTISPVSGHSTTIESLISFTESPKLPTSINEWYPDVTNNAKAKFRTTAPDIELSHVYQSAFTLTCGKLDWRDKNGHLIGSKASGLKEGPFWNNHKFNYSLEFPANVLTGLYSMLQTQFYIARPEK